MGSKGSNQIQTSQTYTPNSNVSAAGQLAFNQGMTAAQQPFQLPVAPVAGLTPDQMAAFEGVRGVQGMTAPYFEQARDLATRSAGPISEADVNAYYNPFARNVFDNLAETFGRQTRDVTGRLTNAAGGVGADRIAVGQAELARQQGLAAGQTAASLYLPALQAAQAEKQRQAQGAFALGQLGPAAQASELQGAGALLNVGGLQQQQRQAELTAPYQREVARQAYPFQTSQFLAGLTGSMAPAFGGTTVGTQTMPRPSALSQVLGAGLGFAGLAGQMGGFGGGMGKGSGAGGGFDRSDPNNNYAAFGPTYFAARGGRVSSAESRSGQREDLREGWGRRLDPRYIVDPVWPQPDTRRIDPRNFDGANPFAFGGAVLPFNAGMAYADGGDVPDIVPDMELRPGPFPMPIPMPSGGGGGGGAPAGGGGGGGKDQPEWMKYAMMAAKFAPMLFGAPPMPMADGGAVDLAPGPDGVFSFNDRFAPAADAIQSGVFDPRGANFTTGQPFVPMPRPRPAQIASSEPGFTPSPQPAGGQPFAIPRPAALSLGEEENNASEGILGPNDLPDDAAPQRDRASDFARSPWAALTAAGFGMMAGTSPFPGVNIGKGALEGSKVLERQRQAGTQERRVDLEAKRLMQQAQQFLKGHGLKERQLAEVTRQHNWQAMQPVKIGVDEVGRDVYGLRDPRTGRYIRIDPKTGGAWGAPGAAPPTVPAAAPPAAPAPEAAPAAAPATAVASEEASLPPGAKPVAGDIPKHIRTEILDTLEPQVAGQVKALAEGRMPFPSGNALRTPYWQNMMRLVTEYDPTFDAVNYGARAQTRKNFATGVEARNVTALNTVMGHLDTLDKAGEALQNYASDRFGPLSKKANEVRRWVLENKQDPRVKNFDTAAEAVSNELERAFRGSTTAIAGIKAWREKMNAAMSPQEMKEANRTLTKLLASRIDAMGDQYNRGMGTTKDPLTLLSPDAQATFKRLAKGEKAGEGPKFTGRTATGRDGKKLRETTDGKWVP